MAIMIGLVGFSFVGTGGGQIGQAQRLLLSLLQQVKTSAIASGREARLIVNNDISDEDKYLRYMEVVLQSEDGNDEDDLQNDDGSESWEVQGNGIYLPDKIWFVSEELKTEGWPSDGFSKWSNSVDESSFTLSYPAQGIRQSEGQDLTEFKYISCNSAGLFQSSSNLQLVISSGNLRQTDGKLMPFFPNPKILSGILIQPFGGMFSLGSDDFLHEN